jgi:2-polyprenyl-3-methyl-5-hydroxy-6-metoxy-1,4-benzoquinol methylase
MKRTLYRSYRRLKTYLLTGHKSLPAYLFFKLLDVMDKKLSQRKMSPQQIVERQLWKSVYFMQYKECPPFQVVTQRPVAVDSDDHKWPRGTLYDNSRNPKFNLKLYSLLNYKQDLTLLDLGCAGGGLVKSILEDGYTAVGLEGSDISMKLRSGEWDTCPYHLFTCDIASPFKIVDSNSQSVKFDVVTSWEVLEHIPESKVNQLITNISNHLSTGGYFIGSVDMIPDGNPLTGAIYHLTLRPKNWWLEKFVSHGFQEVSFHPFKIEDYVRGNGLGLKDWSPRDGDGFHLVLRKIS